MQELIFILIDAALPHLAASYLAVNDEAIFALQYNTGSTLLVRMDYISGVVNATEIKESTMMTRLFSGNIYFFSLFKFMVNNLQDVDKNLIKFRRFCTGPAVAIKAS